MASADNRNILVEPYAESEDQNDALGLRVQGNNIAVPPTQSQNMQLAVDRPIASSSRATGQTSSTAQSSKKPWAKGGRVAFKDSVNGKRCAELKLTANTPGPFRCFACDEKGCHQPEPYPTWAKFKTHVYRCQPKDKSLWPRCPFCGDAVPAVNRAWEMERHFAGNGKKRPCPALKRLMDAGMKTNGAVGDWLRAKPHPIETRYLGSRLAEAFYRAAYWRQGRDVLVVL